MTAYTMCDLFAGAGGLTLGFVSTGRFLPVHAVERDHAAALTYKTNFGGHIDDRPIELVERFPDADVVIGGPPCQGFSPLGRDRDHESRAQLNELWRHYLGAVRQVRPKAFVIENVPEFQSSLQFAHLLETLSSDPDLKGYAIGYGVLNAVDYGVPQNRRRGILVAVRGVSRIPWPPSPSHGPASATGLAHRTVRDAIGDLPLQPAIFDVGPPSPDSGLGQDLHFRRNPRPDSLERYRAIPEGGNRFDLRRNRPDLEPPCWANKPTGTTDVMGRLWWDRPALTIRTEFFKPEKGRYLHPEADRPITHREAARLQSFPDTFTFEGSKIEIARQIGNAVPPVLAEAIARHVLMLLRQSDGRLRPTTARDRLRLHFESHPEQPLRAEDLRRVAGVADWTRPLRELRSEEFMNILSHRGTPGLMPGQYLYLPPASNGSVP